MTLEHLLTPILEIDFLRSPRPQGLPAGMQGSEEPSPDLSGRVRRSQNQFYSPWGRGKKVDFRAITIKKLKYGF